MTATNHTEHYELSQYTEDDHPTYTGDYNGDMSKIDAAIHAAAMADRLTAGDIQAGPGVNVSTSGNTVTISYVGDGGSDGLSAVAHDATLTGDGTAGTPLGVTRGGLPLNSIPANAVDIDSMDSAILGIFAQVGSASAGTKPTAGVEGLCLRYRASPLAVVEVIFSNDSNANIYIRRNYNGIWRKWRTVAMLDDLEGLTSRIAALESQVAALTASAAPSATGLSATQLDTQYSDNYNIVRVGTPARSNESEESSHE